MVTLSKYLECDNVRKYLKIIFFQCMFDVSCVDSGLMTMKLTAMDSDHIHALRLTHYTSYEDWVTALNEDWVTALNFSLKSFK